MCVFAFTYIHIYIYMCADLISALQYTQGFWAQTLLVHKIDDWLRCGSEQIYIYIYAI